MMPDPTLVPHRAREDGAREFFALEESDHEVLESSDGDQSKTGTITAVAPLRAIVQDFHPVLSPEHQQSPGLLVAEPTNDLLLVPDVQTGLDWLAHDYDPRKVTP